MKSIFLALAIVLLSSCSTTCPKCPTMKATVTLACPNPDGTLGETPRELDLTIGESQEDSFGIWTIVGGVVGGVLTFLIS